MNVSLPGSHSGYSCDTSRLWLFFILIFLQYNAYGYGAYGYGQQVATPYGHDETGMMQGMIAPGTGGGTGGGSSGGAYNARYHFQAAQSAGFDTGSEDHQPRTVYVFFFFF